MTAEETALDQFRSAVALVRVARRSGRDSLGHLTAVHMLARIIRAIRADRARSCEAVKALYAEYEARDAQDPDVYNEGACDALDFAMQKLEEL